MYPAAFQYHAPKNVKEALGLLGKLKDDAKILAGGHSLIPMMKLRLAQPKHLIDLGRVSGLSGIKADGKALAIGAMTTHWEIESSSTVKSKLPVLAEVAALIGDPPIPPPTGRPRCWRSAPSSSARARRESGRSAWTSGSSG